MNKIKDIFYFGEKVDGYDVRVLNEREARAGAGILFFFAIITFLNSWLLGNFYWTRVFIIAFLIDFIIRILVNPKYAPSLILGRFFVSNQKPEYVGAAQKKFAWVIGLILSIIMFFALVVSGVIGPINFLICLACLILLFFESAFGICLGCKMYEFFNRKKAKLCPGGVCEVHQKEEIQKISKGQISILIIFFVVLVVWVPKFFTIQGISKQVSCGLNSELNNTEKDTKDDNLLNFSPNSKNDATLQIVGTKEDDQEEKKDCEVPEWAKKIGHEELWKLHHNCK